MRVWSVECGEARDGGKMDPRWWDRTVQGETEEAAPSITARHFHPLLQSSTSSPPLLHHSTTPPLHHSPALIYIALDMPGKVKTTEKKSYI